MAPTDGWSASDIPRLDGRLAVVTGANSGIGFVTALELSRHGARVVLACRSPSRGEDAVQRIREQVGAENVSVEFMRLDLGDLASVREFATAFYSRFERLDLLVNNAGLMVPEQTHTDDGLEMHFAVNHLGHFLLTQLLFDALKAGDGPPSRVVMISSLGHRMAKLNLSTLARSERGKQLYVNEYFCSKLANLLFTLELQRRIEDAGLSERVMAVAAHPGTVASELTLKIALGYSPRFLHSLLTSILFNAPVLQQADRGALPTLFAATDASVSGGDFFGPNGFWALWGDAPALEVPSEQSKSKELATELWTLSEQEAGCIFKLQ